MSCQILISCYSAPVIIKLGAGWGLGHVDCHLIVLPQFTKALITENPPTSYHWEPELGKESIILSIYKKGDKNIIPGIQKLLYDKADRL
jgi:hypothetical protein